MCWVKIVDPFDVNLPEAFTSPSIRKSPEESSQKDWFSGIVPFSLQPVSVDAPDSSEIVPLRVPRPSKRPSPVRVWLCIISCEKLPVKSETVTTDVESTDPSPVKVTSPIPLKTKSEPETVPLEVNTV